MLQVMFFLVFILILLMILRLILFLLSRLLVLMSGRIRILLLMCVMMGWGFRGLFIIMAAKCLRCLMIMLVSVPAGRVKLYDICSSGLMIL